MRHYIHKAVALGCSESRVQEVYECISSGNSCPLQLVKVACCRSKAISVRLLQAFVNLEGSAEKCSVSGTARVPILTAISWFHCLLWTCHTCTFKLSVRKGDGESRRLQLKILIDYFILSHPIIHPATLKPVPAVWGQEGDYALDRSPIYLRLDNHSHSHLWPIQPKDTVH